MLQREVEVRNSRRAHRVDERVIELARIEVEETGARHSLRDRLHEGHDGATSALMAARTNEVTAVRREVLGDEDDLGHLELLDLVEDLLDRP